MKLELIRDAFTAIQELMKCKLKVEVALVVRTLFRTLQPYAQDYLELQGQKIDEFGAKDEEGNTIQPGPGRFELADPEAYLAAVAKLDEQEVEIGELPTIKLADIEHLELEGYVLDGLIEAGILDIGGS
jgi:hypothetical protein